MSEYLELPKSKIHQKRCVLYSLLNADDLPSGPPEAQNEPPNGLKNDTKNIQHKLIDSKGRKLRVIKLLKNVWNYNTYWIWPKSHQRHVKVQILKKAFQSNV